MALRGGFDPIAFFTTTFISLTTYTKTIATDLNGTFYKSFYHHLVHKYIFELPLRLQNVQPC